MLFAGRIETTVIKSTLLPVGFDTGANEQRRYSTNENL